ncbi:MAG TPA: FlgD immunoglobulin-like domain containing protein, partial [Candidatus Eisenbacteria bacterium]|nr:FlgD immunoglobulin-like domain containing protein [Candidatus Eisenbacteria bacterium]
EIGDLDFDSIRLIAANGSDVAIEPVSRKRVVIGDSDRNGVADLGACFTREDLRRLLGGARGRGQGLATLEARVQSGRRVAGAVELNVIVTGPPEGQASSVAPNPMNPEGTLSFTLRAPGPVDASLYDAAGRLVRRLASARPMPAGRGAIRIDGRDDRGRALASGIYFYRLRTTDGESRGRVVVAK